MQIRKLGIIEVCRIALETHGQDMEVVRQCRHALGVLGPDSDGGRRGGIGAAGNANNNTLRPNTSGNKARTKRLSVAGSGGENGVLSSPQGKVKKIPGKKTK